MAHTLDELIQMQRAADHAHAQVLALRDAYGRPTQVEWTGAQTMTYEKAWKAWRGLAAGVQAAVTEHAEAAGKQRFEIEAAVRGAARRPE
ncbi:hypothetical protein [Streptomyces antibioticus]|uniref:hypothetical protein n=1 Tax=Streptomyces antibioticus TaxID=1890 RepID=UPI0033A765DB